MVSGKEFMIIGTVYTLITGLVWFIHNKPLNATLVSIGMIIWGIIQALTLD